MQRLVADGPNGGHGFCPPNGLCFTSGPEGPASTFQVTKTSGRSENCCAATHAAGQYLTEGKAGWCKHVLGIIFARLCGTELRYRPIHERFTEQFSASVVDRHALHIPGVRN